MTSLPAQPVPDAFGPRGVFRATFVAQGCIAVYVPQGNGNGALVNAVVLPKPEFVRGSERGGGASNTIARRLIVSLEGLQPGESVVGISGVGDLGGVQSLKVGDTLRVPGWAAGRPDEAERSIRIAGEVILQAGAVWRAEAIA